MNRLEWSQKEPYIKYHVLKWPTSHLHPRYRTTLDSGFELKGKMPGMAEPSGAKQAQPEGIGLGAVQDSGNSRWRSGGLGQEGMAPEAAREAVLDKKAGVISAGGSRQSGKVQTTEAPVVQTAIPIEQSGTAYHTMYRLGNIMRKVGGHIRDTVGILRDVYLKQQKKSASMSRNGRQHTESRKEMRGTRQISKDEVLAMRSENHYLLDSYDRNGQYSTLGK